MLRLLLNKLNWETAAQLGWKMEDTEFGRILAAMVVRTGLLDICKNNNNNNALYDMHMRT